VEHLEGERAEATLWRVRDDWRRST